MYSVCISIYIYIYCCSTVGPIAGHPIRPRSFHDGYIENQLNIYHSATNIADAERNFIFFFFFFFFQDKTRSLTFSTINNKTHFGRKTHEASAFNFMAMITREEQRKKKGNGQRSLMCAYITRLSPCVAFYP